MNVVAIFLLIGLAKIIKTSQGETTGELKFLQTVFRHGDRVPDNILAKKFYPNNLYDERNYYPIPYGGLTNKGKARSFELGKFFRKNYGELLGDKNSVELFCSIIPRTKETVELVATGLFTPNPNKKWNETLQLEEIPINAPSTVQDSWYYYSSVGSICSNAEKEQEIVAKTDPDLIEYLKRNKDFYDYISLHSGSNGTYNLASDLYLTLMSQFELGLEMPEWTRDIFPEGKLKDEAAMVYKIRGFTKELRRFGGGVWLRMWLENIDKFLAGNIIDKKAILWSGHEANIGDLLITLGNFDKPHVPPYNSAVMLELHEIELQHYVKVVYESYNFPKALRILGCPDVLCPLETFRKAVAEILPHGGFVEICGKIIVSRHTLRKKYSKNSGASTVKWVQSPSTWNFPVNTVIFHIFVGIFLVFI